MVGMAEPRDPNGESGNDESQKLQEPQRPDLRADVIVPWPGRRPWNRDDLQRLPADGRRYELIDGALIVTPAPVTRHQVMSAQLFLLLNAACNSGASSVDPSLVVLAAPLDVVLASDTIAQPDLVVAPYSQFDERGLPGAPVLLVEILSPSTKAFDLYVKRERYERAGVEHYWIADPDKPSVTVLRLQNDVFVEQGRAVGPEALHVAAPFDVTIIPSRLVFPGLRGSPDHVVTDELVAAYRDDETGEPRAGHG